MAIIKKSTNNKSSYTVDGSVNLFRHYGEQYGARCFKTLKLEVSYYPEIPLLGIYSKKSIIQKVPCTPVFIVALFT